MKLVKAGAMKATDELLINTLGFPEAVLIENAGRAVARETMRFLKDIENKKIVVLAGKGNNGGDGLAAARFLEKQGAEVTVVMAAEPEKLGKGCALQLKLCTAFEMEVLSWQKDRTGVLARCADADVVLDALLGTSFHGTLREPVRSLIEAVQKIPVPVIAVDIPSGVEADTGRCEEALPASVTVTMIAPKTGLYFYPGAFYTGRIVVADLNTPKAVLRDVESRETLLTVEYVKRNFPLRARNAHKGTNGKIAVLAGSPGYLGAAEMASKAAVRAGGGLVTLYTHPEVWAPMTIKSTEVMVRKMLLDDVPSEADLLKDCTVAAAGPGIGKSAEMVSYIRDLLPRLTMPLVLDADALNALDGQDVLLLNLHAKVLTPHPGEMARLLGVSLREVMEDPMAAAREGAARWQAVVVLKCAPAIIATPEGHVYINSTGNEGMATGGSGDVLTGTIAAFIGQGLLPVQAACCGVYLHGLAGDLAAQKGKIGMKAGDILEYLPSAIARVLGDGDRTSFACLS
jgi:hydroxyethylthiazole kinase-like uncharacterized protein yjeF